jgi:hypothetical protein
VNAGARRDLGNTRSHESAPDYTYTFHWNLRLRDASSRGLSLGRTHKPTLGRKRCDN